jgi:deoxyribodipyrimidine photo-lyase
MSQAPLLVWFRDDLRLGDHPALSRAAASGAPVICLYIRETPTGSQRAIGAAAGWWLAQSLRALDASLRGIGNSLVLRSGTAEEVITDVAAATGARTVLWNRRYDAGGIAVDKALKASLREGGTEVESLPGNLLREPWEVKSAVGDPMKVFSPFWRAHQRLGDIRAPLRAPSALPAFAGPLPSEDLQSWELEPTRPNWASAFPQAWTPGEAGAQARLTAFLDEELAGYADGRDRPDRPSTSRLSPHLRFGEISPVQIWHQAHLAAVIHAGRGLAKFLAELGWREFAYHLLFHWPNLAGESFQPRFEAFPFRSDPAALRAWQRGLTGYPLVDAGMRQLWQTGWMHNRVRMVVASFLVKHLLLDWREGESWFWDTLVDADVANNPASWQWVAGSGADAAPYFRIFNPVLQGEKFDPRGDYVRRWVPELAALPAQVIHAPWKAPAAVLAKAGVTLGETYPAPIVDHDAARERALAALSEIRDPTAA